MASKQNKFNFHASVKNLMNPVVIDTDFCIRNVRKLVFNLKRSQKRILKNNGHLDCKIQILMRVGLLSGEKTLWDKTPTGFVLHVNNNSIRCPRSPINLNPYIRSQWRRRVVAHATWSPGNRGSFVFSVVSLKMKNTNNFIDYIKNKGEVKRPLRNGNDVEVTSQSISLLCPLSFKRIELPAKSKHCYHLQCFDASTFFSLNLLNPKWACPVCLKLTYPQDVVIDGLWTDMLSKCKTDNVSVRSDGSWLALEQQISEDKPPTELA